MKIGIIGVGHIGKTLVIKLATVARETEYIGLVATGSTTFNEPFNLARQFKALDVITSSGEDVAVNYGTRIPSSEELYGRAHEVIALGKLGKRCLDSQSGNRTVYQQRRNSSY